MVRTSTTSPALAAVAAAVLSLSSCSSGDGDGHGGGKNPSARAGDASASTSASETPTPSPTGPCADGTCQVTVGVGDVLEVPASYGLGPIEVTAVGGDDVEMVAPIHGSGSSIAGCSGGGSVTSPGGGGVRLRCGKGPAATLNDVMRLTVVEVNGKTAVLRIAPA
ncbi:hypothetical protein ACPCSG_02390 [Streptomyces cellulosae]